MAVEEIYGLFADSDPDGALVGAAEDATDEEIQAKHKQLAEAAVNAVERGDDERLRKVLFLYTSASYSIPGTACSANLISSVSVILSQKVQHMPIR